MHWSFKTAQNAFSVAVNGDKYYNDATWNVTYVDSHDYAPDELQRIKDLISLRIHGQKTFH